MDEYSSTSSCDESAGSGSITCVTDLRLDRGRFVYAVDVEPISPGVMVTGVGGSGMSMMADEEGGVIPSCVSFGPPLDVRPRSSADESDLADGVALDDALL